MDGAGGCLRIWNRRVPVVNLLDRADHDVENELEFEGSSDIAG